MQSITGDEAWRPVVGYEGLYEVSNTGVVRALERTVVGRNQVTTFNRVYPARIMSFHYLPRNYIQVFLAKNGKTKGYLVHRLVAEAFIPNPENKPEVNHKDRNPANNTVENLEWVSKQENMDHAIANGWDPKLSRLGAKSTELHKLRQSLALTNRKDMSIPCRCIETGQTYPSISEAARQTNLGWTSIKRSIDEHKSIFGKYTFDYVME